MLPNFHQRRAWIDQMLEYLERSDDVEAFVLKSGIAQQTQKDGNARRLGDICRHRPIQLQTHHIEAGGPCLEEEPARAAAEVEKSSTPSARTRSPQHAHHEVVVRQFVLVYPPPVFRWHALRIALESSRRREARVAKDYPALHASLIA